MKTIIPLRNLTKTEIALGIGTISCLLCLAGCSESEAVKDRIRLSAIRNNVVLLQAAKDAWAFERLKQNGDVPTTNELAQFFKGEVLPATVAGEAYMLNPVGTPVVAKLSHKIGKWEAGQVLTVTNF